MRWITSEEELEQFYGTPNLSSTAKVSRRITPQYRALIDASPFCALASVGDAGLDCSPRGDDGPVADVVDESTLAIPDRRGNNRIDTLRNIVRDPRISLMFMIPRCNTIVRVNGLARVTADPRMCDRYTVRGSAPRTVILVRVSEVYFQCARAILRARLWDGGFKEPANLPTPGEILDEITASAIDGKAYDAEWPGRAAKTMW
ncbi:MAG: pyridoxamine 5'-phosphate oxidase family protein [Pseudomonadota bacterium]